MSGRKIIEGLKDAVAGDFSRVTIEGQTWVRIDRAGSVVAENERLRAALVDLIDLCRHKASNREEEKRVEAAVAAQAASVQGDDA